MVFNTLAVYDSGSPECFRILWIPQGGKLARGGVGVSQVHWDPIAVVKNLESMCQVPFPKTNQQEDKEKKKHIN